MTPSHESAVVKKTAFRIIPFLLLLYIACYIDRTNVSFAALQMNQAIGLTPATFGIGAGIFFVGMLPFEVPSNLMMVRFGARIWLARIIVLWGLVTFATALISGPKSFYLMRLLLGISEAGFFPGVLFYLTFWFPRDYRAKMTAQFMIALPIAAALGGPISSGILQAFDGWLGIPGWRWVFIATGIPAMILGVVTYKTLLDKPRQARWLSDEDRNWLQTTIDREQREIQAEGGAHGHAVYKTLVDRRICLMVANNICTTMAFFSAVFWLPQIIKSFHVTNFQVGLLSVLPNVLGVAAMLIWSRRCKHRSVSLADVLLPQVLVVLSLVGLALSLNHPVVALISICLTMIGLYASMPMFWTLPTVFFGGASAAVALAFINAVGNMGGFFGPALLGFLTQETGSFKVPLIVLSLFVVFGMSALTVLRREYNEKYRERELTA